MIVMLGHKMFRGKDTVGNQLISEYGFNRVGFADELKRHVMELYEFTHEQCYGKIKNVIDKRYNITPRQVLQDFGQEQRIRFYDIWAHKAWVLSVKQNRTVITDFRFPNEYDYIKTKCEESNTKLYAIKIDRPSMDVVEMSGKHNISETALDDWDKWDHVIVNDSTQESLELKVRDLFNKLTK